MGLSPIANSLSRGHGTPEGGADITLPVHAMGVDDDVGIVLQCGLLHKVLVIMKTWQCHVCVYVWCS